jgi:endonuclease/exonuclease/phosphatase family metal-dependent hydrolase
MYTKSTNLTVATYNILHGYYRNLILRDVRFLIEKGADVLCLQETEVSFEDTLNEVFQTDELSAWKIEYAHCGIGGNIALAWNASRLTLKNLEIIPLPTIRPKLDQRLRGFNIVLQRGALAGTFLVAGTEVRITSAHLAWEGGVKHRIKQLAFLRHKLEQKSVNADIIGGDFNTFAPSIFYRIQEKKVEETLGEQYVDVLPDLPWSYDLAFTAPQDGWQTLIKIFRLFGIKMHARLDYLFARNIKVSSAKMINLPGSDHKPLIASFELLTQNIK